MRITRKYKCEKKTYRAWVSDYDRIMAEKLGIPFNDYVKAYIEQTIKDKKKLKEVEKNE